MRKAIRFAWGGDEDSLSLCAVSPGLPQPGSLSFPLQELSRVQRAVEGGECCSV